MIRVSSVLFPVTALGPGRRLGVWLQGCTIECVGCMSRDTWDADGGVELPVERLVDTWRTALERGATGLTISGGEPSDQPEALVALLEGARTAIDEYHGSDAPDRADILLYTGRSLDELLARVGAAARAIDAVVTHPYDIRRPTTLIWRGSANQELVMLSDLGRVRYAPYVDHRPEHPTMQVIVDKDVLRVVGVPRRGDLARLERDLREAGVSVGGSSWRP